mgnify:CR=1 FL=1
MGKFIPQLVEIFLRKFQPKLVYDPFCGSGIIPIEAALLKGNVSATDNQYYCIESTKINSKLAKVKIQISKTFFDFIIMAICPKIPAVHEDRV